MCSDFLNTYRPLCATAAGRHAIETYELPPFVDGSCRREPDFEAQYPAISALCRTTQFAPRLRPGDRIAYLTCALRLPGESMSVRHLVALLEVIYRFEDHADAAEWYRRKDVRLPRNCLVRGNPPLPLDQTNGLRARDRCRFEISRGPKVAVRNWDAAYWKRAAQCGVFLACKPLFRELQAPPLITHEQMVHIFGRVPGTQTPPRITRREFTALERLTV